MALLPIGVANRNCGGAGRDVGRCSCGSSGIFPFVLPLTGFIPGDGGMARPRRGTRVPLVLRLPPGIGGRRRGAAEDMIAARVRQLSSVSKIDR